MGGAQGVKTCEVSHRARGHGYDIVSSNGMYIR
jgi:hypothetical protein